jgi:transcriptional regulator with XRE-family HTH domain
MTIGDFLRQVRERAELTQAELAAKLGVTQSAVAKIEGRDDVLVSTLISFVKAAGGRYEINAWLDD